MENNSLISHGVVALIERDGKFLLLKDSRQEMLNKWAPPHGRCEADDVSEEDAVIREVREETGLKARPVRKLWTTTADTKVKTVSFWLAEYIGGEIKLDTDESSEYNWFSAEEALALQLYPGTKEFFLLVKSGEIII